VRRGKPSWRQLRKRSEELLEGLVVPDPFDLDEFAAAVGRRRGKPIRVVDVSPSRGELLTVGGGGATMCGLLLQFAGEDIIVVEARDWVHRVHVGLHEIAHLECGHLGRHPPMSALRLFPDLDESMVRGVFGRTGYSEVQEREAEGLASLLSARLIGRSGLPARRAQGDDQVMARLERAIGGTAEC
jgi:hypothetical protein